MLGGSLFHIVESMFCFVEFTELNSTEVQTAMVVTDVFV